MDEKGFVASRRALWDRLGAILAKASAGQGLRSLTRDELRALGPLYRRAAADLAYARAHAVSPALVTHINQLVARAYALLYQTDTRSWKGLLRFFTHDFPRAFRRRLAFFAAAVAMLSVGAAAGYVMVSQSEDNIYVLLPPGSTLHDSVEYWKTGKTTRKIPNAEAAAMASFLMQNNIRVSLVAYAGGITGGLLTGYITFENGAVLGAMSALMSEVHRHRDFWPQILPHGIVELSETCLAAAAGLSIGWALLAPGAYRRRDALVIAARDSVQLIIGGIFLLIFAGLVEAFLSHSRLPTPLKLSFAGREPLTALTSLSPPGSG